jgi:mRNA interferase MazF
VIYKPYSIVIVPFPFTDSPIAKKRPALVLSHKGYQEQTGHVTLLMITSAKHSTWASDHAILNLKTTGLSATSIIRQKIFTIDERLVLNEIGYLSADDKKAVLYQLQKHMCI